MISDCNMSLRLHCFHMVHQDNYFWHFKLFHFKFLLVVNAFIFRCVIVSVKYLVVNKIRCACKLIYYTHLHQL